MQVALDGTTRRIYALGGAYPGTVSVDVIDAVAAAITAALPQVQGDGYVTLAADLATVAVQPPSADWLTSAEGIAAQHRQALAHVRAALTANGTTVSNDLAALQTIVTALQAGTPPTQAQLLALLRFLLRALAVLNR